MAFESTVLTELESMDLKGAKVLDVLQERELTYVKFEIVDVQIDFTATDDDKLQTASLTRDGKKYVDEAVLKQCDGWVKYVWANVEPILRMHKREDEKISSTNEPSNEMMIIDDIANEIQEAHKEGYKAARVKNIQEIRKIRRRYRIVWFLTVAILVGAFAVYWFYYRT